MSLLVLPGIQNIKEPDKLIVCSANLVAFISNTFTNQILVYQPGASWSSVKAYDICKGFEDMTFHQGKLYILDYYDILLVVNLSQGPSGNP
jgi:hypothetical protein